MLPVQAPRCCPRRLTISVEKIEQVSSEPAAARRCLFTVIILPFTAGPLPSPLGPSIHSALLCLLGQNMPHAASPSPPPSFSSRFRRFMALATIDHSATTTTAVELLLLFFAGDRKNRPAAFTLRRRRRRRRGDVSQFAIIILHYCNLHCAGPVVWDVSFTL